MTRAERAGPWGRFARAAAVLTAIVDCASEAPIAALSAGADAALTVTPPIAAVILADSVADFSETTQGVRGWYYGYVDPVDGATFVQMSEMGAVEEYVPRSGETWPGWFVKRGTYWTQLFKLGGHGNGTITTLGRTPRVQYAVRRWISNFDGNIVITGQVAKIDISPSSNGVDARVEIDGVAVYAVVVEGTDQAGRAYSADATVHAGSTVDFVIDPHAGDDQSDLSRFTGTIAMRR
jgi:hypothetical protein